ncbi:MAG: hypothetical protein K9N23_08530 [Akkermansiaceae bacterium]|nr:hypothetical protein [Akkermansiaceae bacterium]
MEQKKTSLAELRKEASSDAKFATGYAIFFTLAFMGSWMGSGLVQDISGVLCIPGVGALISVFPNGYNALEKYWMIRQMKRGEDVDARLNVARRNYARALLYFVSFAGGAVLWAVLLAVLSTVIGFPGCEVPRLAITHYFLVVFIPSLCLGVFAYAYWPDVPGKRSYMAFCKILETPQGRDVSRAVCQLLNEIGLTYPWVPKTPSLQTVKTLDRAILRLRQSPVNERGSRVRDLDIAVRLLLEELESNPPKTPSIETLETIKKRLEWSGFAVLPDQQ